MINKKYIKVCFAIFILSIILVNSFIDIVRVNGDSMLPTLNDGEFVLSNKFSDNYKRFDIIIFKKGKNTYIKRIIGLPKERLYYQDNILYINGEKIPEHYSQGITNDFKLKGGIDTEIPSNCYYVLGDNREDSLDSRGFGYVLKEEISSKLF